MSSGTRTADSRRPIAAAGSVRRERADKRSRSTSISRSRSASGEVSARARGEHRAHGALVDPGALRHGGEEPLLRAWEAHLRGLELHAWFFEIDHAALYTYNNELDEFISIEQALHPAAEPTLNLPLTDLPLLRPRNGGPTDRGRFAGLGLGGSSGRS